LTPVSLVLPIDTACIYGLAVVKVSLRLVPDQHIPQSLSHIRVLFQCNGRSLRFNWCGF